MQNQVGLRKASLQTKLVEVMEFQVSYFKSWKRILWKCCTHSASKFGKLSSGHRTGKSQFSFQSQRRAMPKSVQTTEQLYSSHTLAKCWIRQCNWTELNSGYICENVFCLRLAFESGHSNRRPSQREWVSSNLLRAWVEEKAEVGSICSLPVCLLELSPLKSLQTIHS